MGSGETERGLAKRREPGQTYYSNTMKLTSANLERLIHTTVQTNHESAGRFKYEEALPLRSSYLFYNRLTGEIFLYVLVRFFAA